MADPFLAEIRIFAPNFPPEGWAFCSGQLLSIAQNSALFSLLGTIYGGDGEVTFALPDLRGRYPRGSEGNSAGPGLAAVPLGSKSGGVQHNLSISQMPSHSHTTQHSSSDASTGTAGVVAQAEDIFRPTNDAGTLVDSSPTTSTGGGTPFSILDPYLGLNYIIALVGLFPQS